MNTGVTKTSAAAPTISWDTPSNNSTVTGLITLRASGGGDFPLKKWCLKRDGQVASSGFTSLFYIQGGDYYSTTTFDNATGCWTSTTSIGVGYFTYDTTAWPDGTHTYQLVVTDSANQTTSSSVLTINNSNEAPTVIWDSPMQNSTHSGLIQLRATAQPANSGTAKVMKWCLKRDGQVASSGFTSLFYIQGGDYYSTTTFDNATGCWTSTTSIGIGYFTYDTTAWPDGTHTYQLVVTDSSGRSTTSSLLTINNSNENPTVAWDNPLPNSTQSGTTSFKATAQRAISGTAKILKWCLKLDGQVASTGFTSKFLDSSQSYWNITTFDGATGCWTSTTPIGIGYFTYDTTRMLNGSHSFSLTVTDSSGRSATSALQFKTFNVTKMEKPTFENPTLYWPNTKPSISIYATTSSAKTYKVQYGTTRSMKSTKSGPVSTNQSIVVGLKNLKPNTVYYLKVSAIGLNGTATSAVKKIRTPKRPSPPPSTTAPTNNGGSRGGTGGYVPFVPIVPVYHGLVVAVGCDLRESGLSSSWYGQSYSWTIWKIYQDGFKQVVTMGSGYNPPAVCY